MQIFETVETNADDLNRHWRVHDAHGERYYSASLIRGKSAATYALFLDYNAAGAGSGISMTFTANEKVK